MIRFIYLFVIAACLHSCAGFKYPEVRSTNGVKMLKMDGRDISLEAKAVVHNPNWFSLKVKPSKVFISAENQSLGSVQLEEKVTLKGKRTDTLTVPITARLDEGAMLTIFRLMNRDSIELHITGKVKGGIAFLSKKQKIDIVRSIPGNMLKFGMGGR